jgi:hypothetical protein
VRAHCVTLLRLAMHAEKEHPGNALEDESFAFALKEFSDHVEYMMAEDQPITYGKLGGYKHSLCIDSRNR